jgi:glycosyltransferase involved in cell wall biosynthesis
MSLVIFSFTSCPPCCCLCICSSWRLRFGTNKEPQTCGSQRGHAIHRELGKLGKDTKVNVQVMGNTPDPRQFWRQTRVALLPSLWWENQPLAAIEAMINGVPVIGSDRGGIPETLGAAGICLPLPDRLTPATQFLPTAEEVEPWVQTVIRLWDDLAFYEEQSLLARQEALRWHPDRLRPLHAEFFGSAQCQAGPPRHVPV